MSDRHSSHIIETKIANGANVSARISHENCRGFGVMPLAGWTAADIVFQFLYKGNWYPINDKTGVRLRISGVKVDELNDAPAEVWPLGRFQEFRVLSVAVGLATAVNQAAERTLVVVVAE